MAARQHDGRPANGLMIAFAFSLPYHVMRTAAGAGLRVHVLGSGPSRGLRLSRHCASYRQSRVTWDGEPDPEALLDEIREIAEQRAIDIVFPSDDVSTRMLAAIRDRLPVRSTPLPELATFDLLNDKGNFTRYALDRGVRVPECWLYDRADEVRRDLLSGALPFPVTVKPTNRSGSAGVMHIRNEREMAQLESVDYHPILVQQHIVGETIGISTVCRDGKVLAHATKRQDDRRFEVFADPELLRNVEKVVSATRFNGPANFDAVVEQSSGMAYIVECNPRFWYTIYLPMMLGLNFFEAAVSPDAAGRRPAPTLEQGDICLSLRGTVGKLWKARPQDRALLAYHLGDPLIYLLGRTKLIDDAAVAVRADRMQAYAAPPPASGIEPPAVAERPSAGVGA